MPDLGEAEIGRRDDAQFAARLVVQLARRAFGLVELGENAPALFVKPPPGFGGADAPRGAVEEARAEPFLELQHMLAGRRARQAEPLGGRGEPAGFDDGRKNPCVFKAIHRNAEIVNQSWTIYFALPRLSMRFCPRMDEALAATRIEQRGGTPCRNSSSRRISGCTNGSPRRRAISPPKVSTTSSARPWIRLRAAAITSATRSAPIRRSKPAAPAMSAAPAIGP